MEPEWSASYDPASLAAAFSSSGSHTSLASRHRAYTGAGAAAVLRPTIGTASGDGGPHGRRVSVTTSFHCPSLYLGGG